MPTISPEPGIALRIFSKAIPPEFTFAFLAMKAFLPEDRHLIVLSLLVSVGMFFHNGSIPKKLILMKVLTTLTCFAFVVAVQIDEANIMLQYLVSSTTDFTNILRFWIAVVVVANIFALGLTESNLHASSDNANFNGSNSNDFAPVSSSEFRS